MTYKIKDGGVLEAKTPHEIVEKLKAGGRFTEGQDNETYMAGFAFRAKEMYGLNIRIDSIDNFVADLLSEGYLIAA